MLEIVKQFLKLEGGENDNILSLLIANAEEYLAQSGVVSQPLNPQYQVAVIVHVLLHYENYDKSLNVKALEKSLQTSVLQLRSYGGIQI